MQPKTLELTLSQISERVQGRIHGGDETRITGVAGIEGAETGDIVFAETSKFLIAAIASRASAILVSEELASEAKKPLIIVSNPRVAFVQVLEMFSPVAASLPGIHSSAIIGAESQIARNAHLGANVVIGERVSIDDGVAILSGSVIGDDCVIGSGTKLQPNVTLYPGVTIGRNCLLHSGCVIGADGFGYVPVGHSLMKVPHLGTVEIGDEVEIGANSCIDRAKTGKTVIGSGTKIDNLVHVAHNVTIGMSCLLIAQAGVAGSTVLGNGVVLAGQAGIKDHLKLGDGARVGAQGGVIGDVPAGVTVSGYPARPHGEKMREYAAMSSLPEYLKRIRALEKRLAELDARMESR